MQPRLTSQQLTEDFSQCYEMFFDEIFRYIRARTKSTPDAEDIAAEVFVKAYKNRRRYSEQYTVRTWLYSITKRTLIDHWRKQRLTIDIDHIDQLLVAADASYDIDSTMQCQWVLQQLNEPERALLIMRFQDDLTYKQIAKITGKSEGALRTMFSRIKGFFEIHGYET